MAKSAAVDMARMHNLIVYSEDGQALSIKSLWKAKPAIFVFLRHFSCLACRAHVAQVWSHRFTLEQDGARIYFIGNGSFREILKFKKEMGVENALIFTDPSRRSYEAAGLKRGILPALGPQAVINGVGLLRQGFRQKRYHQEAGDLWQLGGVLVINPGGLVRYQYISQATGDFPTAVQIAGKDEAQADADVDEKLALPSLDFSMR